jgi:hypothetical protein
MRHLAWGVLGLVAQQAWSQVTINNNNGLSGAFVGWNAGANQILDVKNEGNERIQWYTDGIFRMLLNQTLTYGTLGGFNTVPANGFALITPSTLFLQSGPKGPFSRLHLAEGTGDNNQSLGYRPWQINGITFTGNADHGYIGQKYRDEEEDDYTDMVIQWSDNPGFVKADRMRFIFTTEHDDQFQSGAKSKEGLEGMRLWPKDEKEMHVGVGDFFEDGSDPTERFHVLNGRVRIEDLPDAMHEAEETFEVMVVDATPDPNDERGVVKWKHLTDLLATDCEWTMNPTTQNNVSTAFGPSDPDCPDRTDAVGIGVDLGAGAAPAKLLVFSDQFSTGMDITMSTVTTDLFGLNAQVSGGSSLNAGIEVGASGPSTHTRGVRAITNGATFSAYAGAFISNDNATYSVGTQGRSNSGVYESNGVLGITNGSATVNYGVKGTAAVDADPNNMHCGIFGEAAIANNSWAGCFNGNVNVVGTGYYVNGVFVASDAALKTNIEPLETPLATIMQLQPQRYMMRVDEYPQMHLPSGEQVGLIAQELESIIPNLVSETRVNAVFDSLGIETHPAVDYKAVNYTGLIPYLIGSIQEQQATITAQNDRLDQLESLLLDCCNRGTPDSDRSMEQEQQLLNERSNERSMQVVPNPFQTETTIHYNLEKGGRVQLMANSADGKQLRVLNDATSEAGVYQFNWNTADLAAGIYYVSLLLDGEPITKRAVKIDR